MELNLTNGHIVDGLGLQNLELFSVCVYFFLLGGEGEGVFFVVFCICFMYKYNKIQLDAMRYKCKVENDMQCSMNVQCNEFHSKYWFEVLKVKFADTCTCDL